MESADLFGAICSSRSHAFRQRLNSVESLPYLPSAYSRNFCTRSATRRVESEGGS